MLSKLPPIQIFGIRTIHFRGSFDHGCPVLSGIFLGAEVTWTERQLVVRSVAAVSAGEKSLRTRLDQAQKALAQLSQPRRGKKRLTQLSDRIEAAEEILRRARVQGLLRLPNNCWQLFVKLPYF